MTHPVLHLIRLTCIASLAGQAIASIHNDRWRWSNPAPHGNNVLDMLTTSELGVQVGDAGSLHVQRTDERWAPAYTGVGNYLRGVALLGERIIAVGENGCILWSDDGAEFSQAQLSPPNTLDWFEGVAASVQRAVAVGDYGAIYTSTNGASWMQAVSGTTEWMRGVAFGNGAFVAVGENGKILRSITGTAWSSVASGTTEHLNRVRYLGKAGTGQFVAVGDGGVALASTTGTAPWTSLGAVATNNLYDVALNESGMLIVGDQEIRFRESGGSEWISQVADQASNGPPAWVYLSATGNGNVWRVAGRTGMLVEGFPSDDGSYDWQPFLDSSRAWLWDATVQDGLYVAVGDLATIQTSLDGILWASEAVPVARTNTVLLGVGGTTNLLLAVGNDGNVLASRAGSVEVAITNQIGEGVVVTNVTVPTYGLVWTNLPPFTTNTLQGIVAAGDLFLASGANGSLFTSADGTNWTGRATPTAHFLSSVAIGSTACVAVGENGTLLRAGPGGESWTAVSMGTSDWLYRVRWLNGLFVVVGQNGRIHTSSDGLAWTQRNSGTTRWLTDITFVDGTWFATGYQGTLLASANLADWTKLPLPTGKSLFAAATRNGQLVVAGIEGVVLRNQVVPHTSPIEFLDYSCNTVLGTNSTSMFEVFLLGGVPDQVFQFQSSTNLSLWGTNAVLELFDPSGTIYVLRTREESQPAEFYRTLLQP
jgi:hypothetical protein